MTPKDNHEDLTDHDLLIRIDQRMINLEKDFEEYKARPHGVKLWAQVGGVIVAIQIAISMLAKVIAAYTTAGVKGP